MGLSLPFSLRAAPTAWDGGIRILCWPWLKSKGCVALCHPASLELGSDAQLAALNQAQQSILS